MSATRFAVAISKGELLVLAALLCMTGVVPHLQAQIGTSGTFSGTVRDATGAVVPGAKVTATHLATGAAQSAITDGQGRYQISLLPLGEYRLEALMQGFRSKVQTGLVLTVGKDQELNFTLEVGEVTETVTVEGGAPLVETRSATVASLVSSKEVIELPLNGRSFDQLIALSAGVVTFADRNVNAFRGVNQLYSIGGTRPNSTKLMVDGSEYAGGNGISTNVNTASGKMLGVDGIQEFAVVTNNGDASYGKKGGGQVNIVTRAGTNEFHGSLFEFLRNDALDARNFFDPEVPPLRRNNFGWALGGPVVHNRTFFFTNFEKLREVRGNTVTTTVPTVEARKGNFPAGSMPLNPASSPILDLFPLPNGRDFGDGTAEAFIPVSSDVDDNFLIARVDHHFSEADSLFGRYLIQTGENVDGRFGLGKSADIFPTRMQLISLGYTKIVSPRLVNQATIAFNRGFTFIDTNPLSGVAVPPALVLIPGEKKTGGIAIGLATLQNTLPTLGGGTAGIQERFAARNVWEFADQVNYTTGAHDFRMGFEAQLIQSNEFEGAQKRGFLRYNSLEDVVRGQPFSIAGPLPGSDGFKSFRENFFGLYFQDSVKVTSRFTLNLGLRWELMTNPTETHDRIANWVPEGNQLAGNYTDQAPIVKHLFTDNQSGNFAPRIGFAWDVFGTGGTAVRGGFGMFYSQMENEFRGQNSSGPPFWNQAVVTNPPFPNPGASLQALGQLAPKGIDTTAKIPTVLQYNLRIEQKIAPETLLGVAYAGSHGYHQVRQTNPQVPVPFVNKDGRLEIAQTLRNAMLAPNAVFQVFDSNSFYHSLQVDVIKNFSHGLRFKTSFTWAKNLDDAVQPVSATSGVVDRASVATDHRFDRGLAPHHVGRQLVSNWSYDLPVGGGLAGAVGKLLRGWQLGGILTVSDGSPFTAQVGFRRSHRLGAEGDRPDLVPGRSNNAVLGGPDRYFDPTAFRLQPPGVLGNVGSATMIGPGLFNLDFSLSKNTPITERVGLLFRAEFFNLLNRPNFAIPVHDIFNSNGTISGAAGRVRSTITTSREIQFGLKLTY